MPGTLPALLAVAATVTAACLSVVTEIAVTLAIQGNHPAAVTAVTHAKNAVATFMTVTRPRAGFRNRLNPSAIQSVHSKVASHIRDKVRDDLFEGA